MGKDGGAHGGKDKHKGKKTRTWGEINEQMGKKTNKYMGKKTSTWGRRQAQGEEDEQMEKKTKKHMGKKTDEK